MVVIMSMILVIRVTPEVDLGLALWPACIVLQRTACIFQRQGPGASASLAPGERNSPSFQPILNINFESKNYQNHIESPDIRRNLVAVMRSTGLTQGGQKNLPVIIETCKSCLQLLLEVCVLMCPEIVKFPRCSSTAQRPPLDAQKRRSRP